MFATALAAVPRQPSTATQCAVGDFLGAFGVQIRWAIGQWSGREFA